MVPHLGHAKIMAVVVAAAVFYVGIGQRQKEGKHYSSYLPVVN